MHTKGAKSGEGKRINVVTLGCSKNIYDSEVLMGQLKASGKDVVHEKEGEIVVVNTCGFIDNAKQESIDTILDMAGRKSRGEIDKLIVTGCLSERYRDELEKEIPEVDHFFGTRNLPELVRSLGADYRHELIGERLSTTPPNYAYFKISEGCDRPCSFCAIPLMRGGHRSTPVEELVNRAGKLAARGVRELILIAQDSTYYGLDLYGKRDLARLLKALVAVEGIDWIRLHYAFPTGFPEDVLKVMREEPKVCSYLDIPLQHISDPILKSMKRGTTMEKTNRLLQKIRTEVPGVALRTTLIVGYPGETERDFDILKDWVEETRFDRLGCFAYSHEEGTTAYRLTDDVPTEVKLERVNQIMELQGRISWELNQQEVGKRIRCMVDRKQGPHYIGRTEKDSPEVDNEVLIDTQGQYLRPGEFVEVEVTSATDFDLYAQLGKAGPG